MPEDLPPVAIPDQTTLKEQVDQIYIQSKRNVAGEKLKKSFESITGVYLRYALDPEGNVLEMNQGERVIFSVGDELPEGFDQKEILDAIKLLGRLLNNLHPSRA